MSAVSRADLARVSEQVARLRQGGGRRPVPKDLRQQVMSLVTAGMGVTKVARSCGLSPSLVYKWRADLRSACARGEAARRLVVVHESPVRPSLSPTATARLVIKDMVIEFDASALPSLIAALRVLP